MKLQELKKETDELFNEMPPEADWDDLMYQIYVRKKIEAGLRDSINGRVYTTDQVRKSLNMAS
jgi:predicted transcriptional regulator